MKNVTTKIRKDLIGLPVSVEEAKRACKSQPKYKFEITEDGLAQVYILYNQGDR